MDFKKMKQNGMRKSDDIMMNLLDASSDSDPDPLNLPPLKGKRFVKRKKSSNNEVNTSVCNLCSFIKILAIILTISLLGLLGVLTLMMYEETGNLRKQLGSVETKNLNSATEIINLKKDLEDLKKKVESSLLKDSQQFTDVNNKINELSKSSESLKSMMSVDSKQELDKKLEQLSQIPVVSKTVADIGSDVENLKTKLGEFDTYKETVLKQVVEKVSKLSGDASQPSTMSTVDTQVLDTLNETLRNRMNSLESVVYGNQLRIGMLENRTIQMQTQMSQSPVIQQPVPGTSIPEEIKTQLDSRIQESINKYLQNKTEDFSDSSLTNVLTNMDNITAMVKSLKDQLVQLKTDHSDMLQPNQVAIKQNNSEFADFKTVALTRLETLNKSVDHLSHDVSTLMHKFILNQNSLTSLTRIVEGIKQYITILETKMGMSQNETGKSDDPELAKLLQAENISIPLDGSITKSTASPETTTLRPVIHMHLVKTPDDLALGLHRWDKNGNGVLDGEEIESLPDYMPDPPTPDQVKQFDFDHTGSLDLDELMVALGFKPYPSEDERQRLSDLG